jgi:hypothetical protein
MLHIVLAVILSTGVSSADFPNKAFNKEVVRMKQLAKKTDAHLRVNAKTVTVANSATGYICIWDDKSPKLECLQTYVLNLSAAVSTGVVKIRYERVRDHGNECGKFLVTENVTGGKRKVVDRSVCLIDGQRTTGIVILDKDDLERDVVSKITCLGSECDRKP